MRIIILTSILCSFVFAANKATKPYTFTTGTIRASEVNKNGDSIYVPFNALVDTVNKVIVRFKYFKNGDTLIDTLKASRAYIDTGIFDTSKTGHSNISLLYTDSISPNSKLTLLKSLWFPNNEGITWGGTEAMAGNSSSHYINFSTNNADRMRIAASGNVGIGIDSGTCKLDVVGMVKASLGFTTNGSDTFFYDDTTFADTLREGGTYKAAGTARIIRCGASISFLHNTHQLGASFAGGQVTITGIPLKFLPADTIVVVAPVMNNSTIGANSILVTGSFLILRTIANAELSAGTGGLFYPTKISWMK